MGFSSGNKKDFSYKGMNAPVMGNHTLNQVDQNKVENLSRFNHNNTAAEQFDILHFNKTKEEIQLIFK